VTSCFFGSKTLSFCSSYVFTKWVNDMAAAGCGGLSFGQRKQEEESTQGRPGLVSCGAERLVGFPPSFQPCQQFGKRLGFAAAYNLVPRPSPLPRSLAAAPTSQLNPTFFYLGCNEKRCQGHFKVSSSA
jgi:hypothetical protein